ncbi:MAG: hypothetical protein P8X74_17805 [Reinekea sp.]
MHNCSAGFCSHYPESVKFLGSKEESMACALRRYGVTDSGL